MIEAVIIGLAVTLLPTFGGRSFAGAVAVAGAGAQPSPRAKRAGLVAASLPRAALL